jgi:hypothetical protein
MYLRQLEHLQLHLLHDLIFVEAKIQHHPRTPENPLRGMCQGPDKILTFGVDVCADLDNFRVKNMDMFVSQSRQFWASRRGWCQSLDNFGGWQAQAWWLDWMPTVDDSGHFGGLGAGLYSLWCPGVKF